MATKKVAKKPAAKKTVAKKVAPKPTTGAKTTVTLPRAAKRLKVANGPVGYTTSNIIKQPVKKVWEAAVLGKHLKQHFVDDMRCEFDPKCACVGWFWKEWGWWNVEVVKVVKHKELVMRMADWENKYLVTTRFEFVAEKGRTIFRVHESGYPTKDLKKAFMMCEGWTEFHCGVKAYLLYGKKLNKD
jgi:uncharacterized protein YndB with AHSA1/START domain